MIAAHLPAALFELDVALFRRFLGSIRNCNLDDVELIMNEITPVSRKSLFINASLPGDDTALICACKRADTVVIKYLLFMGADPNKKNSAHESPMSIACHQGFLDIVVILLEYGAQLPIHEKGKLPVQYFYNDKIMKLLVDMGLPLDIEIPCDMEAVTASYLEIWNEVTYPASQLRFQHMPSGNIRGLNLLLNHGAEISFFCNWSTSQVDFCQHLQDFYLQHLLFFACRYGLVHVAALCLARDNGNRCFDNDPSSSPLCETAHAVSMTPIVEKNIFAYMLLETFHPTIILLLLGFPIYESVDILGRFFGEYFPQKTLSEGHDGGEWSYYRKFRRQRRLCEEELTEWSDDIVLEILKKLAPSTLSCRLETTDREGNTVLLKLLTRRPSFHYNSRRNYATLNVNDFGQYIRSRDSSRRAQRFYFFTVRLLMYFGAKIDRRNNRGESVLEILLNTSQHPKTFFDHFRDLDESEFHRTPYCVLHGSAINGNLVNNEHFAGMIMEEDRRFSNQFMRWCYSFIYSKNETSEQFLSLLASSVPPQPHQNQVVTGMKNWCSAHWPQTLLYNLSLIEEIENSVSSSRSSRQNNADDNVISRLYLIDQCITPELSLLLLECVLFQYLYFCTYGARGDQDSKDNALNSNAFWIRFRRRWWLWTSY